MGKNINETERKNDEFNLLSEMMLDIEGSDGEKKKLEFEINGTDGKDALLFQLGLADELQLVAVYGKHHLVFPIQMKMGAFANFSLNLKSPKIFETGGELRSWRLPADQKIAVVSKEGKESRYKIKDLSASGISLLIDDEDEAEFPELLTDIYLQLPGGERLAISGSQIRRIDNKTVAYSLDQFTDETVLASLTEYLFECHAEKHPEAHADNLE